jgi:hypothetical protein
MESHKNTPCVAILAEHNCPFFFFNKIREEEGRTGTGGIGTDGRGENMSKGCRRVSTLQTMCICACKWKNETC